MLELDRNNFEEVVLQGEGAILVDFYGDGCVPCAALTPHIEALEEKYGDQILFTALNTTKARRLSISQRILGLPVVAIYQSGEKVEELVKDDCTPEAIEEMVKKYI